MAKMKLSEARRHANVLKSAFRPIVQRQLSDVDFHRERLRIREVFDGLRRDGKIRHTEQLNVTIGKTILNAHSVPITIDSIRSNMLITALDSSRLLSSAALLLATAQRKEGSPKEVTIDPYITVPLSRNELGAILLHEDFHNSRARRTALRTVAEEMASKLGVLPIAYIGFKHVQKFTELIDNAYRTPWHALTFVAVVAVATFSINVLRNIKNAYIAKMMRNEEYRADRHAADYVGAENVATMLAKMELAHETAVQPEGRAIPERLALMLYGGHPSLARRIRNVLNHPSRKA